ncbi:MAG: hypothetical protein Q9160_003075 [Pyrenula sp. 1 TL-2023]
MPPIKVLTAVTLGLLSFTASAHPLVEREGSLPAKYAELSIYGYSGYNNCDPETLIWWPAADGKPGLNPVIEDFVVQPEGYVNSFGQLASVRMSVKSKGVDVEVLMFMEGCNSDNCMKKVANSRGFSTCVSPKIGTYFTNYIVRPIKSGTQ